jgi:hypothetical protein
MRKEDIKVGRIYTAKVSGTKVQVKIVSRLAVGFKAKNLATNRTIRIRTAARLSEAETVTETKGRRRKGDKSQPST